MKTNDEFIKELNGIIENMEDRHIVKRITSINDNFYGDLAFDSLSLVELIFDCEHYYNIDVKDEEIEKISTVGELINLLKKYIEK
jgi:acyl carrier protein